MSKFFQTNGAIRGVSGALAVAGLLALGSGMALAQNPGHGPQGTGAAGNFGGNSAAHISAQGMANTNGPNAEVRLFGRDRAGVRMNQQGIDHSNALQAPGHNPDAVRGNSANAPGHNK